MLAAGRGRSKKISPHPKHIHEIHCDSSPATSTTSRRRATKHVPRVRPYTPASIDPWFVGIGLTQFSHIDPGLWESASHSSLAISKNHERYTDGHTDRHTDKLIKYGTLYVACTHPGVKRLFCPIGKNLPLIYTRREVNEARRPRTCSRPCAFEEKENGKKTRNPAAPKTHDEIHRNLATATTTRRRATKLVSRVSLYSPASIDPWFVETGLVQVSQSVYTTNVTHRHKLIK